VLLAEVLDEPPELAAPAARTGPATIMAAAKMMSLVDMAAHRNDLMSKFYSRCSGGSNVSRGLFYKHFDAIAMLEFNDSTIHG
jgi:hypothetical protein